MNLHKLCVPGHRFPVVRTFKHEQILIQNHTAKIIKVNCDWNHTFDGFSVWCHGINSIIMATCIDIAYMKAVTDILVLYYHYIEQRLNVIDMQKKKVSLLEKPYSQPVFTLMDVV